MSKPTKLIIVSAFHEKNSVSRSQILRLYCDQDKIDYQIISANFSHSLKKYRRIEGSNILHIKVPRYYKNVSIARVYSNLIFSIKALRKIKTIGGNSILYIISPPNTLLLSTLLFGRKKVVVDVIDLWPEALPIGKYMRILLSPLYRIYKFLRHSLLSRADLVITESNYFYAELGLDKYSNSTVLHLKKWLYNERFNELASEELSIGYLGNLGHIYDFEGLIQFMTQLRKLRNCKLIILGDGEKKHWLLEKLKSNSINFEYHNATYEEDEKYSVLSGCWFGFNGYVENTKVALSYKSIDYMSYGLPLINSTKGDTYDLIDTYDIGVNYQADVLDDLVDYCADISYEEILLLKKKTFEFYLQRFSRLSYTKEMRNILRGLV